MSELAAERTFSGAIPDWRRKRNKTYAPGRVCEAEGCSTRLSVYNRSRFCWQHEPVRLYVSRDAGRKKAA